MQIRIARSWKCDEVTKLLGLPGDLLKNLSSMEIQECPACKRTGMVKRRLWIDCLACHGTGYVWLPKDPIANLQAVCNP